MTAPCAYIPRDTSEMMQIGYLNRQMPNIIIGKLDKKEVKMEHIITDNIAEALSVIINKSRLSLKHTLREPHHTSYTVTILNRREIQQLADILNNWLKNNVDRAS